MSWRTEIDRVLRHSVLARAQPFIRSRTPWLHRLLIDTRDRILPFDSRHGITRYQHRAIERFMAFHPDASHRLLEVGSDLDGRTLRELSSRGFRHVIGVNPDIDFEAHRDSDAPEAAYQIVRADARSLPFQSHSFSALFTVATFEHIHDLGRALDEMYRILRPGALVYADFGPIWSCSVGHHVYAIVDGVEARHWKPGLNPVPHFGHFLLEPDELNDAVLEHSWVFPALADAIIEWIYHGDGVNRLFYEDYLRIFEASPFEVVQVTPVREHVPRRLQARLEDRCPGYREFGVRMVEAVLRRS